jgi:hypothetical protein
MDETTKRITIYAPAWLAEAIKRIAAKERRSVNQEILRALEEHAKKQEKQN